MKRLGVRLFSATLACLMAFMSLDVNAFAAQTNYENISEETAEALGSVKENPTEASGISELEKQLQAIEKSGSDITSEEEADAEITNDVEESTENGEDIATDVDGENGIDEETSKEGFETNENLTSDVGLVEEHEILTKGTWSFFVDEEGRAHITGNSNISSTSISIPNRIGDNYVISIEENAFTDFSSLTSISIPFYINSINENAFGKNVTIRAYWGTYALNFAMENGYKYENKSQLDFADGVMDFSDIDRSHFSFITSNDIEMNSLEASCLSEGSVIYMPSSEGNINGDGFKVLSIENKSADVYILHCERALGNEVLNSIVFNETDIKPDWNNAIIYFDADNNGVYEEYSLSEMDKIGNEYTIESEEGNVSEESLGYSISYSKQTPTGSFSISQGDATISIGIDAAVNAKADIDLLSGKVNEFNLDITNNVSVSGSEEVGKKEVSLPSRVGKFPLAKVPVQSTGLETIYVIFSVGMSLEGSISVSYTLSLNYGFSYQNGSMHMYRNASGSGNVEAAITGKLYVEVEVLLAACGILYTSVAVQGGVKAVGSASLGVGTGSVPSQLAITVSLYAELTGSFSIKVPGMGELYDISNSLSWEKELFRKSFLTQGGACTVKLVNTKNSSITSISANAGEKIKQPDIKAVNGQAIIGWYKDSKLTQLWNFDRDTVKGDMYLYAKWGKAVKVTYVYPSETKLISKTVLSAQGALLDMPSMPKVMEYMYIGCYKDSKYTSSWNFIKDKVPATNLTIYVKYVYRKGYNPWKAGGVSGENGTGGNGSGSELNDYTIVYGETFEGISVRGIKTTGNNLDVVIPTEINGRPIVEIESEAFCENDAIVSISIPSSVTAIYNKAFDDCANLVKVTWDGAGEKKVICDYAFYNCTKLVQLNGLENVTYIGYKAFENSGLSGNISLNKLTYAEDYSFKGCNKLKSVTINANDVRLCCGTFENCSELEAVNLNGTGLALEDNVFCNCSMLRKLDFPSGLTSIYYHPVKNCSNLEEVSFSPDTNISFDNFFGGFNGIKKLTIPYLYRKDLESSESGFLSGLFDDQIPSSLEEVILTGNITKISDRAFYPNDNSYVGVKKVVVPASVKEIGTAAFYKCNRLAEISDITNVNTIGSSAFSYTGFSEFKIPEGVKVIQGFSNNTNLESVVIPNTATVIKDEAFKDSGLKSVVIPNNVTEIGEKAFYNNKLSQVYIPDNVTLIKCSAFANNTELRKIRFPKNGELQSGILEDCCNIESVEMPAYPVYKGYYFSPSSISNRWSYLHPIFLAPPYSKGEQEIEEVPSKYPNLKELVFNNGTTINGGLKGWSSIERIVLSDTMTSITGMAGTDWFDSFDVFVLPASVTEIGEYAFQNCDNLKELNIPKQITRIKDGAFAYCDGLEKVYIPSNIEFGKEEFKECTNLHEIEYDKNLKEIPDGLFSGCIGLKSIEIPEHIERIGSNAFSKCSNLQNVYIANGVQSIGECVFEKCTKIKTLVVPNSVTNIDRGAFAYCSGLEELTVPSFDGAREDGKSGTVAIPFVSGISTISHMIYTDYPKGLRKVTLTDTTQLIGKEIFSSPFDSSPFETIKEIYFPAVTTVEGDPFANFENQSVLTIYGHGNAFAELASKKSFKFVDLDKSAEIEFCSNGSSIECLYAEIGKVIEEPEEPIREGYRFAGWFTDETYTEEWDFELDLVPNIEKLQLYAKWVANHEITDDYVVNNIANGVEIVEYHGTESRVNIPEEIDNKPVIKIDVNAFSFNGNIFKINIPSSVSEIEEGAFSEIKRLSEITVDEDNEYFCSVDGVLYSEDMTVLLCYPTNNIDVDFVIPDSVRRIGDKAFKSCSLNNIDIPSGVEEIGNEAFYNCNGLLGILLPNSIKTIGQFAFDGTSAPISGPIDNEIINEYFDKFDIDYNQYVISFLIDGCEIYTINVQAGMKLSPEVKSIIKGLNFDGKNVSAWIIDGTEDEFDLSKSVMPQHDLVLHAKIYCDISYIVDGDHIVVTGIGDGNVTDPIIPESINGMNVTAIDENAFTDSEIKSVTIPDCVTSIAENVFDDSVTIICNKDSSAYSYAVSHNLSIKIRTYRLLYDTNGGNTVADVFLKKGDKLPSFPTVSKRNHVFDGWYKDEKLSEYWDIDNDLMPGNDITLFAAWNIIDEDGEEGLIYEETNGTLSVVGYNGKNEYIEVPSSEGGYAVTSIADGAFMNNKTLRIVNISDGIISVGEKAFLGCTNLEEIEGAVNVKELGNYAFAGCTSLSKMDMSNMSGLEVIPERCFMSDINLLNVTLPNNLKEIGKYAFSGCTYLENVTIPSSVITIGDYAFYCNELVKTINIPASVSEIGYGFVDGCSKLAKINVATNNSEYKSVNGILYDKYMTKVIRCPEGISGSCSISKGVVSIEEGAFKGCLLINNISIPNGLKSIKESAFYGCNGIEHVVLPTSVETINDKAFAYCNTLKLIEIGRNVSSISKNAFYGTNELTIKGYEESVAETFALSNKNLSFEYVYTSTAAKTSAPIIKCIQNTTIELEKIDGYEYKINGGEWQTSNIFTNLQPLTKYTFYQRVAANKGCKESVQSVAVTAKTGKAVGKTLKNVVITGITMSSITAAYVEGSEYSIDGIIWQESNVFGDLQNDTEYTVYQRMAETNTSDSGRIVSKTVTTGDNWVNVIIDANGGYFDENKSDTIEVLVEKGKKLFLPELPQRVGYDFSCWLLGDEEYDFDKEITESFTIIASWEKQVVVTLKANGGTFTSNGTDTVQFYSSKGKKVEEVEIPRRIDYEFSYWSSGNGAFDFSGNVYEDVTVVAIWNENEAICETPWSGSSIIKYGDYIELYCSTPNAKIYYTLDGSDPEPGASNTIEYEEPIQSAEVVRLNGEYSCTININAIAVSEGCNKSDISYNEVWVDVFNSTRPYSGHDDYYREGFFFSYYYPIQYGGYDTDVEENEELGTYMVYTGEKLTPRVVGIYSGRELTEGVDYTIKYSNNINAGKMTITMTGKGNYKGKKYSEQLSIVPLDISSEEFSADSVIVEYNSKKAQKPGVVLLKNGKKLGGKDYSLSWVNEDNQPNVACKEPGTYSVDIIGTGNYTGRRTVDFEITEKHSIQKASVSRVSNRDWTGEEIKPEPIVKLGGKELVLGQDYNLSYNQNIDSGKATICIKGMGDYYGENEISFTIKGIPLSKATISGFETKIDYYLYGNPEYKEHKQNNVEFAYNGTKLIKGVDYTETYSGVDKLGKATVEFIGCGKFEGKIKKTYTLAAKNIKEVQVKNMQEEYVFDGKPIEPNPWLYYYDDKGQYQSLSSYDQYTVTYKDNAKPGVGKVVIKGKGDYSGSLTITFKILPYDISSGDDFSLMNYNSYYDYASVDYSKGGIVLSDVGCRLNYYPLTEGVHYKLNCEKITNAYGADYRYKCDIIGKGLLTGSKTVDLCVYQRNIEDTSVQVNDVNYSKTKTYFCVPVITDDTGVKKAKMVEGTDYEISCYRYTSEVLVTQNKGGKDLYFVRRAGEEVDKNDIIPIGTSLNVSIRGINNYYGEVEYTYKICNHDISKASVKVNTQKFAAHYIIPKKSDIKVIVDKKELSSSEYEIVSITNNYNVGTATMVIRGKGEYGGEKKVTFKIVL